jgi:hypothetical protein
MKQTKEEQAIMECYAELFKHSNPSADFKQLLDNAEVNERGQRVIDFRSYEIEENLYREIVDSIIKKYKFKSYKARAFKFMIALGCSPKTKTNNNE